MATKGLMSLSVEANGMRTLWIYKQTGQAEKEPGMPLVVVAVVGVDGQSMHRAQVRAASLRHQQLWGLITFHLGLSARRPHVQKIGVFIIRRGDALLRVTGACTNVVPRTCWGEGI
jgi:hypothetical protein